MGGAVQAATTMTIDVLGPDTGRKVNITLYLADWERLGRELAVETREYGNLQLATPTTRVRNFTEGCKLRFEVQVPIRFRLMEVAAPLPHNFAPLALSALFFDALETRTRNEARSNLLERDELGRRGSTDTGPTVTDRLVRDAELGQIVAHHVGLDLNRGEDLAVVHAHHAANHLRDDDHVTQVRLDRVRLVVRAALLLGLAKLLHKRHTLLLQAAREAAAGASVDQLHQLLARQIEQSVEVDATEGDPC